MEEWEKVLKKDNSEVKDKSLNMKTGQRLALKRNIEEIENLTIAMNREYRTGDHLELSVSSEAIILRCKNILNIIKELLK